MDFTWTVPVALILAATIYLTVARYLRHRERMAPTVAKEMAALSARLEALEDAERARA